MDEPILKRENQIGITYNAGEIRDFHYEIIFKRVLRIQEEEIDGIDSRCPTRFLFKVKSNERYATICEQATGRDIPIGHGCVIQVDDISSSGTRIELSRVPFQVSNDMICKMLQQYGEVYKCTNYYRKFGIYRNFNYSGDRIVWIKLDKHIPQSLLLKQTQTDINVKYPNQPFTCNKCGNSGHKSWRCNIQSNNYINVVDLYLNDPLETEIDLELNTSESELHNAGEIPNVDISENDNDNNMDLDIHIDASQNTNCYECNVCVFKCSYIEIFNDHMRTHSGEKSFRCCICDSKCDNVNERNKCEKCENPTLFPNRENILACSECEYKCNNVDILNNHLKTHNIYVCSKCDFKSNTPQALTVHVKTHKQKTFKCCKCEYECTTLTKLNAHKKDHPREDISAETFADMLSNDNAGKTPSNSKIGKRDLSISPEVTEIGKKTSKNSISNKKPKT